MIFRSIDFDRSEVLKELEKTAASYSQFVNDWVTTYNNVVYGLYKKIDYEKLLNIIEFGAQDETELSQLIPLYDPSEIKRDISDLYKRVIRFNEERMRDLKLKTEQDFFYFRSDFTPISEYIFKIYKFFKDIVERTANINFSDKNVNKSAKQQLLLTGYYSKYILSAMSMCVAPAKRIENIIDNKEKLIRNTIKPPVKLESPVQQKQPQAVTKPDRVASNGSTMSYKHISFDQSEVLMELEKIAQEQQRGKAVMDTGESYQKVLPSVQDLERDAAKVQNIEQALEYVLKFCEFAGSIPTPVGNPLAYVNLIEHIKNDEYRKIFGDILDMTPTLGTFGLAFKNFPQFAKVFIYLNQLFQFKNKKITFIQNLFRNNNWNEVLHEVVFRSALESVDQISLKIKGVKISDKILNAVEKYIENFISSIAQGKEMTQQI